MAPPQPPADPNQQPANPYGGAVLPDQPAQPYGAPAPYPTGPYPTGPYPTYPPAGVPAAPSQPMYPPQPYPPQYAPPAYPGQPPVAPSQPMYSPTYPPGYASSPSMPMYQQPPQPYPYGMQPGMPGMQPGMPLAGTGAMNFALLTQPKQRGFFIAAIAGVVLLLSFFILPFFGATVQVTGLPFVGSGSAPTVAPYGPISANVFAGSLASWLWLVPLCALAVAGLAGWRAISPQPGPNGLDRRTLAIAAAALGGVSLLLLLIVLFGLNGYASTATGVTSSSISILGTTVGETASGSLSWGYWIMLLAALGVGIGGIIQINTKP